MTRQSLISYVIEKGKLFEIGSVKYYIRQIETATLPKNIELMSDEKKEAFIYIVIKVSKKKETYKRLSKESYKQLKDKLIDLEEEFTNIVESFENKAKNLF